MDLRTKEVPNTVKLGMNALYKLQDSVDYILQAEEKWIWYTQKIHLENGTVRKRLQSIPPVTNKYPTIRINSMMQHYRRLIGVWLDLFSHPVDVSFEMIKSITEYRETIEKQLENAKNGKITEHEFWRAV